MNTGNSSTYKLEKWLNRTWECDCGKTHSLPIKAVVIDVHAYERLADYCQQSGMKQLYMICDQNTWQAAGKKVQKILELAGISCEQFFVLANEHGDVVADEQTLIDMMVQIPADGDAIIAVGAGTIHDIVRFVTYKMGFRFLSVPTAPSVDGFVSTGAPIVLRGFKQTIPSHTAEAIFADTTVLKKAPIEMIAAGFGDLLGKFTSLADWKLGHLLQNEYMCKQAESLTKKAVRICVSNRTEIRNRSVEGMKVLMEALILSGISMLMVRNSRPASGGEHHISHFWEMKGMLEGKKSILHGAKVGVACLLTAQLYHKIVQINEKEVANRIHSYPIANSKQELAAIKQAFGSVAQQVICFKGTMKPDDYTNLSHRIIHEWAKIKAIAASVPDPLQMKRWLKDIGAPVNTEELAIPDDWVEQALTYALYVRNRFTILHLKRLLCL